MVIVADLVKLVQKMRTVKVSDTVLPDDVNLMVEYLKNLSLVVQSQILVWNPHVTLTIDQPQTILSSKSNFTGGGWSA